MTVFLPNQFDNILKLFNVLPQVKRCAIITYKHGIYNLLSELPNNVRLRILGSLVILRNWQPSAQSPRQNASFAHLFHMKTRASLRDLVSYCSVWLSLLGDPSMTFVEKIGFSAAFRKNKIL